MISEIVQGVVGGISEFANSIGDGINSMVSSLFTTAEGGLSVTGSVIIAFAGLALAIGLTRFVTKWIMSLGAKK